MGCYTPGKWEVLKCSKGDYVIQQKKLSYRTHPPMFGDGRYHKEVAITDNEADAVLIAAAPEMEGSLRNVLVHCANYAAYLKTLGPEFAEMHERVQSAIDEAAAILRRIENGE